MGRAACPGTLGRVSTMHAVAYTENLPVEDERSLVDVELPLPEPGPQDLLIDVRAVSVNPVDVKLRVGKPVDAPTVLGFDGAGVVVAAGAEVVGFSQGDEVMWAGSIARPGSNAERQVVDHRIVGRKPASLSFAEAAALPLTTITAWESLFEVLALHPGEVTEGGALLVTAAAGGVGSIALQLARLLTGATLIGTASRPESQAWAREMGAHHVVDHHVDLVAQVRAIAPDGVERILSSGHTDTHFDAFVQVAASRGRIVAIDEPEGLDTLPLKDKSVSFTWEFMQTRVLEGGPDLGLHGRILDETARRVDAGALRTTATRELSGITAATLREAHALVEDGSMVGKVVLAR